MAAAASMISSSLAAVLLCAAVAAAFFSAADAKTTTTDGDLVTRTCANVMSHDWKRLSDDKKFCESRLRLDKRSASAKHPRDLALVAMDLAQRSIADADAKVAGALRSGDGHHRSNATTLILRNCRLDYAAVASTIPVCRAMAVDYKPGAGQQQLAPNDHFECARRLRLDTWNCYMHAVFKEEAELVYKEIKEAWLRVELVEAMLEEMLDIVIDDHTGY